VTPAKNYKTLYKRSEQAFYITIFSTDENNKQLNQNLFELSFSIYGAFVLVI